MRPEELALRSPDEVTNQAPPLVNYNLAAGDRALLEALSREGAGDREADLLRLGKELGTEHVLSLGELANVHDPVLKTHDRFGRRIDEVQFHPAWHELMTLSMREELHSMPWTSRAPGRYVHRAARYYLRHQIEQGSSCPITMTFAVTASLRLDPSLAEAWMPRLASTLYDGRSLPAPQKTSALFGMGMTERQGGSDVRANASKAHYVSQEGSAKVYRIDGHKWFCSAPQSDALLVLAQTEGGLSCFLVPRFRPDGTRNSVVVERLKPKLGNRSNASSEIRLRDAYALLLGDEGRGVATILEMVRHTRLDCCIGGASLIRRALAETLHHTHHRYAFGRLLSDQPLMRNVLADLCLESEAATALMMRLNRSYEEALTDEKAAAFSRFATAVAKFQITRKETEVVREALECHGGNGYIEESVMPRLFRESPLNAIWEGSGNVQCLDALKAAQRAPETAEALFEEIALARGADRRFDQHIDALMRSFQSSEDAQTRARIVVEQLALATQASLLLRFAPNAVSEAFLRSRILGEHGQALGTLPADTNFTEIIERSLPQ